MEADGGVGVRGAVIEELVDSASSSLGGTGLLCR